MVVQSGICKSQVHQLGGRPSRGVASGLRLGPVPSCLLLQLLFGYKEQQTVHKALVQSDDSIYSCHLYHISPCPLPPHGAVWGVCLGPWNFLSFFENAWVVLIIIITNCENVFTNVLYARTDPVLIIGFSAYFWSFFMLLTFQVKSEEC